MGVYAMYRDHTEKIACGEWFSEETHMGTGLNLTSSLLQHCPYLQSVSGV
jgi:hypothetical protein